MAIIEANKNFFLKGERPTVSNTFQRSVTLKKQKTEVSPGVYHFLHVGWFKNSFLKKESSFTVFTLYDMKSAYMTYCYCIIFPIKLGM